MIFSSSHSEALLSPILKTKTRAFPCFALLQLFHFFVPHLQANFSEELTPYIVSSSSSLTYSSSTSWVPALVLIIIHLPGHFLYQCVFFTDPILANLLHWCSCRLCFPIAHTGLLCALFKILGPENCHNKYINLTYNIYNTSGYLKGCSVHILHKCKQQLGFNVSLPLDVDNTLSKQALPCFWCGGREHPNLVQAHGFGYLTMANLKKEMFTCLST